MATKEKEKQSEEIHFTKDNSNSLTPSNTLNCFVITPIGGENDPIRRHIDGIYDAAIVPVLEKLGYHIEIPHRISMPGSINKQIIKKIYDSDLVIANLTNINPNVMYELALRHCFNKPAIMIAEEGTDLPFDINNERTIFYINDARGILDLKSKLKKAVEEILKKEKYNSPVVSVLGEIKFEEQVLERKNESNEDSFLDSLQLILRRLDRIEYDARNNINSRRIPETYLEKRTYRIYAPINYEYEFEKVLTEFIDSCKNRNIRIRGRYIDDNIYQMIFNQLTPEVSDYIDSDLRAFCNHFGLDLERVL